MLQRFIQNRLAGAVPSVFVLRACVRFDLVHLSHVSVQRSHRGKGVIAFWTSSLALVKLFVTCKGLRMVKGFGTNITDKINWSLLE